MHQSLLHNHGPYLQLLFTLAALVIFVCFPLSFVVAASQSPWLLRHDDNCSSKNSPSHQVPAKEWTSSREEK